MICKALKASTPRSCWETSRNILETTLPCGRVRSANIWWCKHKYYYKRKFLQLHCTNALPITNFFSQCSDLQKYNWYEYSLRQRSISIERSAITAKNQTLRSYQRIYFFNSVSTISSYSNRTLFKKTTANDWFLYRFSEPVPMCVGHSCQTGFRTVDRSLLLSGKINAAHKNV